VRRGLTGIRAVIFDLWETLIDWDQAAAAAMLAKVRALAGDEFHARWRSSQTRYTAPVRTALAEAGVPAELMDEVCGIRLDYVRRCLVPRPGAVDTLRHLSERGYRIGLITVCSEDVETLWPESEFAGLFDAEVFSNAVALTKPDPRIYLHCCELLGVEPHEAVFVGDGANDELAGAERAGLRAVQIRLGGEEPRWPEARAWRGPRIATIPQVLELV